MTACSVAHRGECCPKERQKGSIFTLVGATNKTRIHIFFGGLYTTNRLPLLCLQKGWQEVCVVVSSHHALEQLRIIERRHKRHGRGVSSSLLLLGRHRHRHTCTSSRVHSAPSAKFFTSTLAVSAFLTKPISVEIDRIQTQFQPQRDVEYLFRGDPCDTNCWLT